MAETASNLAERAFEVALPRVFKLTTPLEGLQIRPVNKKWNAAFLKVEETTKRLQLVVDGRQQSSVGVFKTLPKQTPVTGFKFLSCNLRVLWNEQRVFENFSQNHCHNVKTLVFENCNLCTGRFYEVVALCKNLKVLRILDSPSIFKVENSIGIYFWGNIFPFVRATISQLEKLWITDKTVKDADIVSLSTPMKNLKSLFIVSTENPVPIEGINGALKNVCTTLTSLGLKGTIPPRSFLTDELDLPKLDRLTLAGTNLQRDETLSAKLGSFLQKCPNLKILAVNQCKLDKTALAGVLNQLRSLVIDDCILDLDTFTNSKFSKMEQLSLQNMANAGENSEQALNTLLKKRKANLTSLSLKTVKDLDKHFGVMNKASYPKLEALSLKDCTGISGPSLKKVLKKFASLRKLFVENDQQLTDQTFEEGGLQNMKELEILSLAGTGVTNSTIHDCISELSKLKTVDLTDTKVDYDGLLNLIPNRAEDNQGLPLLREVKVEKLHITRSQLLTFREVHPHVDIKCKIVPEQGISVIPAVDDGSLAYCESQEDDVADLYS